MTNKLVQQHLLKGRREFEIIDDHVEVRIKPRLGPLESLSVMLTVLNPEPVITPSSLDFTSRVNGEPLLSLYLGKPSAEEFNAFVAELKQRALQEYNAFAGLKQAGNVEIEPPDFAESDENRVAKMAGKVDAARIEEAIQMLGTYLEPETITPLVEALRALQAEPANEARLADMINAFNALGPQQGAVLTYAPYVGVLLYDDPLAPR